MACLSQPELSLEQWHREAVVLCIQTGHQRDGGETGALQVQFQANESSPGEAGGGAAY